MLIITIGRNPDNRIIINDPSEKVSRNHGEIKISDTGAISYRDASTHGTKVNGKLISNAEVNINRNDQLVFPDNTRLDWSLVPLYPTNLADVKKEMTVGTDAANSIQINGNKASRNHAVLKITKGYNYYIYDQSLNGTYVNGTKIPRYQDYKVNRKDKVFFADAQALNWKEVPGGIEIRPKIFNIAFVSIIVGVVGYLFYNNLVNIEKKYGQTVCVVYHSYYLAAMNGDDTLCIFGDSTQSNGRPWALDYSKYRSNPSSLNQITSYDKTGTGFFISNSGQIITNKHVATPWESQLSEDQTDIRNIAAYISIFGYNVMPTNIKVIGIPVKIGVMINGSAYDETDYLKNIIECKTIKTAAEKEVDLALIQTKSKTLPDQAKFIKTKDIITDSKIIEIGDDLKILGYPGGLDKMPSKIKFVSNPGHVSRITNNYEIQYDAASYFGASGSPVFNKQGKLIAINYKGFTKTQGFNFGIIATHLKHLLEMANTEDK